MNAEYPKMAIAIPTRNALIETCISIESCLNQTVPVPIIVVDNYSTDGSFEKLFDLYAQNHAITFFRNSANLGRVGNWNRCLEIAQELGYTHVKFLFSGDEILPNCIEEHCSAVLANPTVAAGASHYEFVWNGKTSISNENLGGFISADEVRLLNIINGGFLGSIVSNVYSIEAIGSARFSKEFVGKTDFDFSVLDGADAYYIPKVLARSNISSRNTFQSALSYQYELEAAYNRATWIERSKSELTAEDYEQAREILFRDLLSRTES